MNYLLRIYYIRKIFSLEADSVKSDGASQRTFGKDVVTPLSNVLLALSSYAAAYQPFTSSNALFHSLCFSLHFRDPFFPRASGSLETHVLVPLPGKMHQGYSLFMTHQLLPHLGFWVIFVLF